MASETLLYATGLLLGMLTALHAVVFVRIGLSIEDKRWRRLWAYSYLVHLWLIVEVLFWVSGTWFAPVARGAVWHYYLGTWLSPYAASVAFGELKKYSTDDVRDLEVLRADVARLTGSRQGQAWSREPKARKAKAEGPEPATARLRGVAQFRDNRHRG